METRWRSRGPRLVAPARPLFIVVYDEPAALCLGVRLGVRLGAGEGCAPWKTGSRRSPRPREAARLAPHASGTRRKTTNPRGGSFSISFPPFEWSSSSLPMSAPSYQEESLVKISRQRPSSSFCARSS